MPKHAHGAKKKLTIMVTFDVTETEYDSGYGSVEQLRDSIVGMLTHPDASLREDYGEDSWGGYDGAFITDAKLVSSTIEDAS